MLNDIFAQINDLISQIKIKKDKKDSGNKHKILF